MGLAYTGLYNIYEFFDKIFGRRLVREHASLSATEISNAGKGKRTPFSEMEFTCSVLCVLLLRRTSVLKYLLLFPVVLGHSFFMFHNITFTTLQHRHQQQEAPAAAQGAAPPTPTKPSPPTWQPTPSQRGVQPQRHGATIKCDPLCSDP